MIARIIISFIIWVIFMKVIDLDTGPNDSKLRITIRILVAIIISFLIIYVNIQWSKISSFLFP